MDINEQNIEQIVQNVLAKLRDGDTAAPAAKPVGNTSRVAMLTELEHYNIKEYPIPNVGTTIFWSRLRAAACAEPTRTSSSATRSG